jgi:hypothetical protein
MGSTHNLNQLLEVEFEITYANSISKNTQGNKEAKEAALSILKNKNYL